jgi:hypothetical protein
VAVIDVTTFRLAAGTTDGDFLAADKRVQSEFVYQRAGLVRRTTARGEDGEWAVVVSWRSAADADAATRVATTDDASTAFTACLDPATVTTKRFETLD